MQSQDRISAEPHSCCTASGICAPEPATSSEATVQSPGERQYRIATMDCSAEESEIRRALEKTKGNRTRAAELLEISHRALLYKIKEFGVS